MNQPERATIPVTAVSTIAKEMTSQNLEVPQIGLTQSNLRRVSHHDQQAGILSIVEDALAGVDRRIAEECFADARRRPHHITLQLLALLAEAKVDAAAWLIIQEHTDHIMLPSPIGKTKNRPLGWIANIANIMSDDARPHQTRDILTHEANAHLGRGIYVVPGGWIDMPIDIIPDTTVHAALGRPLSAVVSHPALDGFGYTITGAEFHETHIELRHDDEKPDIALADLTQDLLWPTPDAVANIHQLAQQTPLAIAQKETQRYDEHMTTTPEI